MKEITEKTFEAEVLSNEGQVLVMFYRESGCSFCDQMKPVFEQYTIDHPEITTVRYKLGQSPDSINKIYPIERFPTFYAFENGKLVGKQEGVMSIEQLHLTFTPDLIPKKQPNTKQIPIAHAPMIALLEEEANLLDNISKLKQHYLEVKREINKRKAAVKEWDVLADSCCDGCADHKSEEGCGGGCGGN